MATYSKYKLYELYETEDGINWFPTGEYKAVLSEMYSDDCGYSARTIVEYDDECSGTTKIITATTKYQETYDSGTTWVTTSSTSSVTYEENSVDCGYSARTITETVDDCSGTTKVITNITKYQESYDSGSTWVTTSSTSSVTYEENSPDCGYTPKDYSQDYLTLIATSVGQIRFSGSTTANTISYSTDNGETWSIPRRSVMLDVNIGDTVMWKGTMTPNSSDGVGDFTDTRVTYNVQGNIMSLLYGDDFKNQTNLTGKDYAFYRLFASSDVIDAKNLILPATTLSSHCYDGLFSWCELLEQTPQLPATTLANSCYAYMFEYCTPLTTAPSLQATVLANGCYASMFSHCYNLTTAPQLPATTLALSCYSSMFSDCSSLTTAPDLLATTLVNGCYSRMFFGCSNLNYIKMISTNGSELDNYNYLNHWVSNVAANGTFVKAASMTTLPRNDSGIPEGWTVQNA